MTRRARSIGRFQIPNSAAWNSDVGAFKSPTRLHETPMPRTVNPGNTLTINTKLKPAPQTQTDRKTETKQTCYVKIVAHVSWRVILAGWETRTNEFARNDSGNVQFACTINWNGINWLRVHGTQSRKAETGQSSPLTAGCYLRPTQKKLCTLLDLCVSSLRRGHANLLCIVPILTDDPRRESAAVSEKYVSRRSTIS